MEVAKGLSKSWGLSTGREMHSSSQSGHILKVPKLRSKFPNWRVRESERKSEKGRGKGRKGRVFAQGLHQCPCCQVGEDSTMDSGIHHIASDPDTHTLHALLLFSFNSSSYCYLTKLTNRKSRRTVLLFRSLLIEWLPSLPLSLFKILVFPSHEKVSFYLFLCSQVHGQHLYFSQTNMSGRRWQPWSFAIRQWHSPKSEGVHHGDALTQRLPQMLKMQWMEAIVRMKMTSLSWKWSTSEMVWWCHPRIRALERC